MLLIAGLLSAVIFQAGGQNCISKSMIFRTALPVKQLESVILI